MIHFVLQNKNFQAIEDKPADFFQIKRSPVKRRATFSVIGNTL